MHNQVIKRRRKLIEIYVKTWSLKTAVKVVSKRFHVSETALRADWNRRHTWPKEVFEGISDPILSEFYLMAIHNTLAQIERELKQITNPSCRVGLIKTKAEILFKLIEVQKSVRYEEILLKRIENLEKTLEILKSGEQSDAVKRR